MKANIHKLGLYIVDVNGNYGNIEEIIKVIEDHTGCECKVAHHEGKTFEWDDDLPINYSDAKLEDYEEYFQD